MSKKFSIIEISLIAAVFAAVLVLLLLSLPYSYDYLQADTASESVSIVGEYTDYSGADSSRKPLETGDSPLSPSAQNVRIWGHLSNSVRSGDYLMLTIKNLCVKLSINGECVLDFGNDGAYPSFMQGPGIGVAFVDISDVTEADEIELEIIDPYSVIGAGRINSMLTSIKAGCGSTLFREAVMSNLFMIIAAIVVAVTGILMLFYPPADKDERYGRLYNLSFSFFAVSVSAYVLAEALFPYFSLFTGNAVICNQIDMIPLLLFGLSCPLYLCVNLTREKNRRIVRAFFLLYILALALCVILQFTGLRDLYQVQLVLLLPMLLSISMGIALLLYEAVKYRVKYSIPLLVSFIPLAASIPLDTLNSYFPFYKSRAFIPTAMLITTFMLFAQFLLRSRQLRLMSRRALELESKLADSRLQMTISQIQPHFMYNVLSTIEYLCDKDPIKAKSAVIDFSEFLRANMDALGSSKLITFENELSHVNNYLRLEKLRFGEKLHIVYSLNEKDFLLPPMTLQPIVENAVKHGITATKQGGTVLIGTEKTDRAYKIIVSDDGAGFDVSAPQSTDKTHIGHANVRERLSALCKGELKVVSEPGCGTVVTITIPFASPEREDT